MRKEQPSKEAPAERIITPIPKALLEAIEDFRYSARIPSRAEAMRLLLEAGLVAKGYKKARK